MQTLTYWKTATMDKANLIEQLFALLDDHQIRYCLIGGQAVNAYVDPLIRLDLDLIVALDQLEQAETLLAAKLDVRRFPYGLNISLADSNLCVQVQTDPHTFDFVARSEIQEVLGLRLPVAIIEDVLQEDLGLSRPVAPRQQAPKGPDRHHPHPRAVSTLAQSGA